MHVYGAHAIKRMPWQHAISILGLYADQLTRFECETKCPCIVHGSSISFTCVQRVDQMASHLVSGQNDGGIDVLNDALPQPQYVRADANVAGR